MVNQYLFILSPPASGSTLLWRLLQTSPNVSAFPGEGKGIAKSILFTKDRWNPQKQIDWDQVKQKWYQNWDLKKLVLLEKSPPHLVRALQLESNFPNSHFIVVMRNPYAFCEGFKRRWDPKGSYFNIAKFWTRCAQHQIYNINQIKNCIFVTYEELTEKTNMVCQKMIDFMPVLKRLNPEGTFPVFEKKSKITNLNRGQIGQLSDNDIFEINETLLQSPELLSYLNYQSEEYTGKIKFKALKRYYFRTISRFHPIGPTKWVN